MCLLAAVIDQLAHLNAESDMSMLLKVEDIEIVVTQFLVTQVRGGHKLGDVYEVQIT